jgi:hypothetical protein
MFFVVTQAESPAEVTSDPHEGGDAVAAHNVTAVVPTIGVVPAAADEVSGLTATQFAIHAQTYQQVSGQAAPVNQVFATTLAIRAGSHGATEASNVIAAG